MMRRAREALGHPALCGGVVGLYVSRLAAESVARAWRMIHLGSLVVLCVGLCVAGAWWLARRMGNGWRGTAPWPLLLLIAYLLWPRPDLTVALTSLGMVGVILALDHRRLVSRRGLWLAGGVFIAGLALYAHTLSPGVLPADGGEFQLVCAVLGIAHPPGYPLYTMLGRLFSLAPLGGVAWRINFYGAVCGALMLAVVAHTVHGLTDRGTRASGACLAALISAGALGLSATYWVQSTTANIRSLTALFVALCLALLLRWERDRSPRMLVVLGACFGLAIGHHSSIGLLGLPFAVYVLVCEPRLIVQPRRWVAPLGAFALSLSVLAYLPLRSLSGAPFDPSPIRSWSDWVAHVLALGFRGDFLYFRTMDALAARWGIWRDIMGLQFGPILPWAVLLSAVLVARRNWRAFLLLGLTWLVNTLSAITYRAPQTVEYLIPSYVAMGIALGYGVGIALGERGGRCAIIERVTRLAAALLAMAVLWLGAGNYGSLAELRDRAPEGDYVSAILREAPIDALILSNWHHATAFWFVQQVEGIRPDVEVRYVYPEGALTNEEVWLRRIAEGVDKRAVIVTNRYHAFRDTSYQWVPFHDAWLVSDDAIEEPPRDMTARATTFGERIEVLGYHIDAAASVPGIVIPGGEVIATVYWRPLCALDRDYSSFVQLVGVGGVVGQSDIVHRSTQYTPGGLRVDAYRIPLMLHTTPGTYQLLTGFYSVAGSGWERLRTDAGDHLVLQSVEVEHGRQPVASLHPLAVRYEGGLVLAGVDYDRGVPGQTRVYLHWRGARGAGADAVQVALVHDNILAGKATLRVPPRGRTATMAIDIPDAVPSVSLRLSDLTGAPVRRLGPWHRRLRAPLALSVPAAGVRYVPLGGEMAYTGMGSDLQSVGRGGTVTFDPRFLTLRPLTSDYSVSVGLVQPDLGIEFKSDSTPAMGAIPTLKWLRGWHVRDPHNVGVDAAAPGGAAILRVAVYDAFTLEPLAVLDERLVRQGQGTWIDVHPIDIR